jgi:hypothetical protein
MPAISYSGGCLCGRVRYEARAEVTNLCFCHCASCRRATGAPLVPWGSFAIGNFSIVQGRLAEYRSSPNVTRGFCAHCGTSLTYRREDRGAEIDVTLSSLDDPEALQPEVHIWVEDKLSWVVITDGRAQFARLAVSDTSPGTAAPP